ncbi:hypothetical protein HJC23_003338 [Cyclotella cryptica]|uniref:Uncharacterized protein n=1 Tax=Cyclotella cryptica TaxID=29204 RepID=A0ABD3R922_9STRA
MKLFFRSAFRLLLPVVIFLLGLQAHVLVDLVMKTNVPDGQPDDNANRLPATTAQQVTLIRDALPGQRRRNCQLVYILGVEGVSHHGFEHIIKHLASIQKDTVSNIPYDIVNEDMKKRNNFLFALYGEYNRTIAKQNGEILPMGYNHTPPLDDPHLVEQLFAHSCPHDGKKHVIIDWHSFPSGRFQGKRPLRVHRQKDWIHMSSSEIAKSKAALNHPFNLTAFYIAYSRYADIKFIVLHRPYLEAIASHANWDRTPIIHSEITRGFIYILRRFLDKYAVDTTTGDRLWHLVCVQEISSKFYNNDETRLQLARRRFVEELTEFLNWPMNECPNCFDVWRESTKDHVAILGDYATTVKRHADSLKGLWPPATHGDQCNI